MTGVASSKDENSRKKFRMAALDLDGTLLNSNHDVSDATVAHLRDLHARGFVVAIATGRSAACTAHIIEKLDLNHDVDNGGGDDDDDAKTGFPLVCINGARGLRVGKSFSDVDDDLPREKNSYSNPFLKRTLVIDEELFHDPLSKDLTLKTLALAHRLGCVTNYYHDHNIYAAVRNDDQMELTKRYARLTGSSELYRYLNNDEEEEEDNEGNAYGYERAMAMGPPSKLLMLCPTERLDEITDLVRAELNGDDDAGQSNDNTQSQQRQQHQANVIRGTPPFFVEILDPSVHKGHGLRRLCESVDVPLEEVIAFGDGDNDLEFIRMAGWGVAMKNGREEVKDASDEVCRWSNDEDGVIKTLQQYELEGKLLFPKMMGGME